MVQSQQEIPKKSEKFVYNVIHNFSYRLGIFYTIFLQFKQKTAALCEMKRRANHLDWGTPQTKRSFASESVISTPQDSFLEYITSNYNGISSYKLGQINSILIKNNKIYNLLENALPKRSFRCNCVKSFCQAKYCQCFRNGQICGEECNCKECKNKTQKGQTSKPQNDFFCKCVKSSCLKKYCECFQNGQRCGDKCQCLDCKNFTKQDLF